MAGFFSKSLFAKSLGKSVAAGKRNHKSGASRRFAHAIGMKKKKR